MCVYARERDILFGAGCFFEAKVFVRIYTGRILVGWWMVYFLSDGGRGSAPSRGCIGNLTTLIKNKSDDS